jgi:uncharacterized Tic20 family protein
VDADDLPTGPLMPGDPPPRPVYLTTPGAPPMVEGWFTDDDSPLKPREERLYAALAHLSQVAGIVVAPMLLLGSLGRRSMFVDRHAKEAFNHQVTYVIMFVVAAVIALHGTGPAPIGLVALYGVTLAAVAALRSWQGQFFTYPLAIRFLR